MKNKRRIQFVFQGLLSHDGEIIVQFADRTLQVIQRTVDSTQLEESRDREASSSQIRLGQCCRTESWNESSRIQRMTRMTEIFQIH